MFAGRRAVFNDGLKPGAAHREHGSAHPVPQEGSYSINSVIVG
jgi:hypothetical protein